VHQVQPACRDAWTRQASITRLEYGGNFGCPELSVADKQQRPDDSADHVLQKAISGYAEGPLVLFTLPACF
jgi:hypothetical protein